MKYRIGHRSPSQEVRQWFDKDGAGYTKAEAEEQVEFYNRIEQGKPTEFSSLGRNPRRDLGWRWIVEEMPSPLSLEMEQAAMVKPQPKGYKMEGWEI